MLESLGVALFCGGFFICAAAYAVIVITKGACGRFLESVKNDELSYLSHNKIDQRVDSYLYTLVSVIAMLVGGSIAMIISMIMMPELLNCLGMLLIGLYGIILVYDVCKQWLQGERWSDRCLS